MEPPNELRKSRPEERGGKRESDELDFRKSLKPIREFVTRPDFPDCVLGEHVDIGGYTGIVVAVVKHSIKVRSIEGVTRSFNSYGLRRIYGPATEAEPIVPVPAPAPGGRESAEPPRGEAPEITKPQRHVIEEPDFDQPVVPIAKVVRLAGYPQSALGKHVDIGGYTGVVVEIVSQSLKVRSRQGISRSYNAPGLNKIYGG